VARIGRVAAIRDRGCDASIPRGDAGIVRIHAWRALRAGPARQRAGDMNADASPPGIALNAQVA
jgi:hypothetical protein